MSAESTWYRPVTQFGKRRKKHAVGRNIYPQQRSVAFSVDHVRDPPGTVKLDGKREVFRCGFAGKGTGPTREKLRSTTPDNPPRRDGPPHPSRRRPVLSEFNV